MDFEEFQRNYRQAVLRESQSREAAFLGISEVVAGVRVKPFTLRHLTVLNLVGSPFLQYRDNLNDEELGILIESGAILREDCAIFLWNVSTKFRPINGRFDHFVYTRFLKQHRKLDTLQATKAIFAFIREAFEDAPASQAKKSVSYYSYAASFIDWIASEYGWSDEQILDMPLKRLWQYVRVIQVREGSKIPLFNSSDKVRGDYLKALNAARN